MNDLLDDFGHRRDGVTIPTIWVAVALSLLIHGAALWTWLPQLRLGLLEKPDKNSEASGTLVVQLAPPPGSRPSPPPSPALKAQPSHVLQAPAPKAAPRSLPKQPVIALNEAAPGISLQSSKTPAIATPAPPRPAAEGDLSSYIEARRRARAESAPAASPSPGSASSVPPVEDEAARSNRIVAANLGLNRTPTFGPDRTHSGGIFQIARLGYNDAEFFFFGWNKDIRRNATQLIEVRKGSNSDIRLAVVRKMISIIREYEQEDFLWESKRLGRSLTLSARARDNAGLEEFMLREFPEFASYGRDAPQ